MASEIARILAYAPMLPVELPAYDLTLHGVETDGKTIDLVIGKSAPIARLHLKRAGAGELVKLSAGPKRARAVRKIGDYSHGDELDAHTPKLQSGVSLGF
ncbi:MAG: hypothetical protein ABI193_26020, partial [Minicystis sp.]